MIYAEVVNLYNHKRKPIEYEVDENGCWVCMSHYLANGYPQIRINGESRLNRVILERKLGRKIKEGFWALHKCNNKACINPDHLYEGNREDNVRDSINDGTFIRDKGEDHWSSKLTESQVLEIRKSNLTALELGKLYNVSRSCVYLVRNGQRWKHLTEEPQDGVQ